MAKRIAAFNLVLPSRDATTPGVRWLYVALRAGILGGRLRPGARLPATRDLAKQYGLSRGTVVSAFEALKSEVTSMEARDRAHTSAVSYRKIFCK
jgi:GntR family transcriptional regulator / MocR family aminotransferase